MKISSFFLMEIDMLIQYKNWIVEHFPNQQLAYGSCHQATLDMLQAFPELIRVRGHYQCSVWGERSHWWLVDQSGAIVDPTAIQFPSLGLDIYIPWDEGEKEPSGMCMNCGSYCYDYNSFCSVNCESEVMADFTIKNVCAIVESRSV